MRRLKYLWAILLVIVAGILLILRGGTRDEKVNEHTKLIEEINSKYYKLTDLRIENMVFWYESGRIAELAGQAGDRALDLAISKAKFMVRWQRGKNLAVIVEGISRQEKAAAESGIKKIVSDLNAKMNKLFQTISPAVDSLIKCGRGAVVSFKKSDSRIMIEISESIKSESVKKRMYFNKDYMLLKTEIYRNEKLVVITKTVFDLYDDKYVLRQVREIVITDKEMKTGVRDVNIGYADNKGFYTPSFIAMSFIEGDKRTEDGELSIVSLEPMK